MSRLEVVRGPPSPIYGPGKVGGYTNFVPKSGRASTGKYLTKPTGKASVAVGSYNKKAASFEIGGPFYDAYALTSNSVDFAVSCALVPMQMAFAYVPKHIFKASSDYWYKGPVPTKY